VGGPKKTTIARRETSTKRPASSSGTEKPADSQPKAKEEFCSKEKERERGRRGIGNRRNSTKKTWEESIQEHRKPEPMSHGDHHAARGGKRSDTGSKGGGKTKALFLEEIRFKKKRTSQVLEPISRAYALRNKKRPKR